MGHDHIASSHVVTFYDDGDGNADDAGDKQPAEIEGE